MVISMRIEFDVKVNAKVLYNYMLYHNYKSFSGIFGTMVGAFMILGFTMEGSIPLLFAGLIVLFYTPYTLFMKSRQQSLKPAFKHPLHYVMTEEGLMVSQGEAEEFQSWEQMIRAVSTAQSIIIYTSKVNAAIFPRVDLAEKEMKVIEMISTHMPPDKVKIKS
ncbi:MAG: YcxB family protein [Eubacteriales bacterium]